MRVDQKQLRYDELGKGGSLELEVPLSARQAKYAGMRQLSEQ